MVEMTGSRQKINKLTLLSGNKISFPELGLDINQPTIKEIAYMGENNFYTACEYLRFSKNNLEEKDKNNLEGKTDFDILMIILKNKNNVSTKGKICVEMLLNLLFPDSEITFTLDCIAIEKNKQIFKIDNCNFIYFKSIINEIFCLKESIDEQYNPAGDLASKIAEKLKNRHKKLNKIKEKTEEKENESIIGRFVSILSVGLKKDMNSLFNYTVYQIFDEFNRFELKENHDIYIKAKLAGAQDLKEVENWMKDLYSSDKENKK